MGADWWVEASSSLHAHAHPTLALRGSLGVRHEPITHPNGILMRASQRHLCHTHHLASRRDVDLYSVKPIPANASKDLFQLERRCRWRLLLVVATLS